MEAGEESTAIGKRLRELREAKGLSQRELAKGTTYSAAYVSRIESSDRRPSVRVLREFAPKLGVSAGFLETGEEKAEVVVRTIDLREMPLEELIQEILRRFPGEAITISIGGKGV